jgi:hypothetical protein
MSYTACDRSASSGLLLILNSQFSFNIMYSIDKTDAVHRIHRQGNCEKHDGSVTVNIFVVVEME